METPYCWEGCGRPATHERLAGMRGEHEVVELVCADHADPLAHAVADLQQEQDR